MGSPKKGVIDLTDDQPAQDVVTLSDSDDEDLKTAIALSLQSMPRTHSPEPAKEKAVAYGILGVDRRQQEQERLARLKRKRDGIISPPLLHRKSPVPSSSTSTRAIASINSSAGPSDRLEKEDTESTPKSTLQYENGVVKKTWAFGHARDQDIKIEEILQRSTLQAAVFSSFQWDMEWFFRKLDTSRTKFVLVMQAKGEAIKHQYRQETASMPNLRLCFPPMDGQVNCMHSKLMLLFHPTYLRVVVPTANLVPYDWGEGGGVMENMVFLIDLPLRAVSTPTRPTTPFKEEMLSFLQAQEMHQDVLDKLELFDFTRTQHYRFIHTMGGSHYEPILRTTGLCGLGKAVKSLSLETTDEIQIDYITSSVGSLNTEFLKLIYQAAQGEDGVSHITKRISGHSTVEGSKKDHQIDWERCFRCYFPSEDTVRSSKAGPAGAGTVCFQEDWWKKPTFPRMIMRDCISTREGMLMHNKVGFAGGEALSNSSIADNSCRSCTFVLQVPMYPQQVLDGHMLEVPIYRKVLGMLSDLEMRPQSRH